MPNKYQHLTLEERTLIQMQLQQGFKPSAIAASLKALLHKSVQRQ